MIATLEKAKAAAARLKKWKLTDCLQRPYGYSEQDAVTNLQHDCLKIIESFEEEIKRLNKIVYSKETYGSLWKKAWLVAASIDPANAHVHADTMIEKYKEQFVEIEEEENKETEIERE